MQDQAAHDAEDHGWTLPEWPVFGVQSDVRPALNLAVSAGQFYVALALLIANRVADGLDGAIARATGPTDRGAFLDIALDFLVYAAVPLGFAAWNQIKRVCEAPTDEDREYLPDIAGKDWLETFHDIMQNYRDESFLLQFVTPKLVRDFRLMGIQAREGQDLGLHVRMQRVEFRLKLLAYFYSPTHSSNMA